MLRLIALSMMLLFLSNQVQSQTISEIPKLLIAEIKAFLKGLILMLVTAFASGF